MILPLSILGYGVQELVRRIENPAAELSRGGFFLAIPSISQVYIPNSTSKREYTMQESSLRYRKARNSDIMEDEERWYSGMHFRPLNQVQDVENGLREEWQRIDWVSFLFFC